jgi:hypothetical protein
MSRRRNERVRGAAPQPVEREPVDVLAADAPMPDDGGDADDGPVGDRPKRFYLALDDEVVRAPSIGPRTAERLNGVGVQYVRDLLAADAIALAGRLASRWFNEPRIRAWQAQARLVCQIPWLRGTHAQMLVGSGFDTVDKVQSADPASLCAAVLRFAGTREGQSVLRSSQPPEHARIMRWREFAAHAEAERAAVGGYRH